MAIDRFIFSMYLDISSVSATTWLSSGTVDSVDKHMHLFWINTSQISISIGKLGAYTSNQGYIYIIQLVQGATSAILIAAAALLSDHVIPSIMSNICHGAFTRMQLEYTFVRKSSVTGVLQVSSCPNCPDKRKHVMEAVLLQYSGLPTSLFSIVTNYLAPPEVLHLHNDNYQEYVNTNGKIHPSETALSQVWLNMATIQSFCIWNGRKFEWRTSIPLQIAHRLFYIRVPVIRVTTSEYDNDVYVKVCKVPCMLRAENNLRVLHELDYRIVNFSAQSTERSVYHTNEYYGRYTFHTHEHLILNGALPMSPYVRQLGWRDRLRKLMENTATSKLPVCITLQVGLEPYRFMINSTRRDDAIYPEHSIHCGPKLQMCFEWIEEAVNDDIL